MPERTGCKLGLTRQPLRVLYSQLTFCLQFTGYRLPGMHPSPRVSHRNQCTPKEFAFQRTTWSVRAQFEKFKMVIFRLQEISHINSIRHKNAAPADVILPNAFCQSRDLFAGGDANLIARSPKTLVSSSIICLPVSLPIVGRTILRMTPSSSRTIFRISSSLFIFSSVIRSPIS